ncbi:hypothetical protein [Vibrio salinus]|uniref:hypothetical protein n=1 Tax=Vibrio salinus TaxID=2899784 RepID=UPI001E478A78|nr:hypothetical protein [Vibrio salinus]MCE0494676.1 hypothetical protein [Vibrio salinus]
MFTKSILIAVVLLQLAIAVTTSGSVRSLAELSAFLVIVGMLWNQPRHSLPKKLY